MRRVLLAIITVAIAAAALPASSARAATPVVKIIRVYYDSPGTDNRTNTSLNGEYVILKNMTTVNRSLTHWTVRDAQNHVYTFGTFTLGPGKTVTLRTGKGTNSAGGRYWGLSNYVWNNDTDKAILRTGAGTTVHTCAYNSTAVDYKNC